MAKRARKKFASRAIATSLAEYSKTTDSPLQQGYRNSIYCVDDIGQKDGKLKSKYCGNRWCLVCASVRTARAWNSYKPELDAWKDAHFVTLTLPNCQGYQLRDTIGAMLKAGTRIKESMKKTDRVPLIAVRKLECTYNAERDDYHPHFHFVVKSRQMARLLVARWLDHFPDADIRAQNITKAGRGTVAELFKYFTKLVTKSKWVAPFALDRIFRAMKKRRVFQPVGVKRAAEDDEGELEFDKGTPAFTRRDESILWEWSQTGHDWIDRETGECLTDYTPGERFRAFVSQLGQR